MDVHSTKHLPVKVKLFDELVAALQWYADEMNYDPDGAAMTPYINGEPDPMKPRQDRGLIARTVLAKVNPEQEAHVQQ